MSGQSFIYGAMVLLLANIFNRAVGFIYQIFMMRLIKPEGVGLFNIAFPVYILLLVVASMGIPVAVSKLVAEEMAKNNLPGAYRVFKISFLSIALISIAVTLSVLAGAPLIQKYLFPNTKVYYCFLSLLPGVIIVSLCSAFRGFFQGLQMMTPTAVTQAVEQLVRVICGLTIAWLLLPRGVVYAAVGISLGVVCGELAGFILMLWIFIFKRPALPAHQPFYSEPLLLPVRRIFGLGVPVTMTRFLSTVIMTIEAIMIPRQLQAAGMSTDQATALYGQFVGIAEALLFTPGALTTALAIALVPAISEALAQGNLRLVNNRVEEALRLTIITGAPMLAVFLVVPRELCQVLFGYGSAGTPLMILAVSGPFLYLSQTVTGMLQGLGKPSVPFKNMLISSAIKLAGIYFLTSANHLLINGAALSLCISYIIMSCLNYRDLKNITGLRPDISMCFIKPAFASAGCGITMWQCKLFLLSTGFLPWLSLTGTLAAGGLSYVAVLYLINGIHKNDLDKITYIIKRAHR